MYLDPTFSFRRSPTGYVSYFSSAFAVSKRSVNNVCSCRHHRYVIAKHSNDTRVIIIIIIKAAAVVRGNVRLMSPGLETSFFFTFFSVVHESRAIAKTNTRNMFSSFLICRPPIALSVREAVSRKD